MDQIKIGQFIAEMRKERGLTQRQLAERMEISDKTVSKWECGNGLPEMSSILPLCEVLQISVNELLLGEKLLQANDSREAEKDMMHLIQETEEQKKKNNSMTALCIYIGAIFAAFLLLAFSTRSGNFSLHYLFEPVNLGVLFIMTLFFTAVSGNGRMFLKAFVFAFGRKEAETSQMRQAAKAIEYVGKVWLYGGASVSLFSLLMMLYKLSDLTSIGPCLASAITSMFYAVFLNLFLLPVKSRLEKSFSKNCFM